MIIGAGELTCARITVNREIDFQTDRVLFSAGETHVRRLYWLRHFELRG
jgi:hypothetical protein